MSNANVLENGKISQDQLDEVVSMALKSLKSLMVDYETPIEIRLHVALRVFEIFGGNNKGSNEEHVMRGLEKNAHDIERNAHQLSGIESLLKLVAQSNQENIFQSGLYSHQTSRVINH